MDPTDFLSQSPNKTYYLSGNLRAIRDRVIVEDMNVGETVTKAGIVIPDDDGQERGIRPRWGLVYRTGPEQYDIEPGQWVLVDHGRWTRGIKIVTVEGLNKTVRMVDPDSILAVSNSAPAEYDMASTGGQSDHRRISSSIAA
jgi:co-chaperonin GroES (HSP10)